MCVPARKSSKAFISVHVHGHLSVCRTKSFHPEQQSVSDLSFVEVLPLDPLEVSVHDVSFSVGNEGLEAGHCLAIDPCPATFPGFFISGNFLTWITQINPYNWSVSTAKLWNIYSNQRECSLKFP